MKVDPTIYMKTKEGLRAEMSELDMSMKTNHLMKMPIYG